MFSQEKEGTEKVIAYASKTLTALQKSELSSVVMFMRHFKHYLLGTKFIIRTDHAPIVWLRNFRETEGLMTVRWISTFETYDYELKYSTQTQMRYQGNPNGRIRLIRVKTI